MQMGFLKSFFAAMAANEISEKKRQEAENKKAILNSCRNVDKILSAEQLFLDYLKQLNCRDVEFSDLITDEQIENGTTTDYDVLHAQQIIDGYKQQLKEFMRIGGDPQYVKNLDRLDLYIEIVKRLKEYGWLDNQQKYIEYAEDTDALDLDWELSQISHQINNAVAYEDINSLSGVEFENVCQALVEKMGFTTQTTKASGDGGIDLIAYNHQPLLSGKYIIQCKRYTGSVGEPIIRDLYGVIMSERANKGILMTTGHFTKSAISFAEGKPIELIDGKKLKSLLTNYGICDETVLEDAIPIKEVFESNIMLEDMYDDYIDTIKTLSLTNDEKERAKFINQLLEWTLSECADINDFNHKLVIFKEIKNQIVQYIEKPREAKSKYLAYLYQMLYVQISILQGNFKDAVTMFSSLMANEEFQFTFDETFEPKKTKVLMEKHSVVFYCMYYTYYDMCQLAALLNDEDLADDLSDGENYSGYQIKSLSRIDGSIEYFKRQGEGREKYWLGEREACNNMKKIHCLYFMSDYEPKMYFNYSYNGGSVSNIALDRHSISLKDNALVVEKLGTIENIRSKIKNYKRT